MQGTIVCPRPVTFSLVRQACLSDGWIGRGLYNKTFSDEFRQSSGLRLGDTTFAMHELIRQNQRWCLLEDKGSLKPRRTIPGSNQGLLKHRFNTNIND
jgi:hypothetical protein